jgi:DNA primase
MIPEATIARIRESANLVEIVREHVPTLKKRGRNYLARCPFHQERTPSFNVNPEMGVFKCFGCGAGGDVFKFLMLTENLTYPEAIRKIAGRVGIAIEEEKSEIVSAEAREKQVLYGLLEDAARFYHRHLMESKDAEAARAYLAKRGLTSESLIQFAIGFSPASGVALRDAASGKGWSIDTLEKAGLVRKKDGGRVHDAFWNRIMFPIWDTQGRIVAFGGRAMGDALPKYINSSETPVYSKSRHLYGLFQGLATVRKERHVVILEGYMDVVTCHQFGLAHATATLGTALTDDHVRLLRRYADRVTLLFDPDAAGAQASLRGGELLVADGFTVDVVTLPEGMDADEVLVKNGRTALEQYLSNAVPFMDYFIASTQKRHPGLAPETKLAIAREVLPVIHKIKDPLLQDEYLARLANTLRVEKAILGQQMKRLKLEPAERAQAAPPATFKAPAASTLLSIEEEMIMIVLQHPSEEVGRLLAEVEWLDKRCAEVWQIARTKLPDGALQISEVISALTEEIREWLTPLVLQERQYPHPNIVLAELAGAWRRQKEAALWKELKPEIDSMIEGRIPRDARKERLFHDLSRRLKGSKSEENTLREAPLHG